ncbi:uncharacterized protein [Littorina saxatilis]|uniref:uncharacterized protein n=1 Tax=Littorina saxatilis TaxID=31220 RepID=UPI0038B43242
MKSVVVLLCWFAATSLGQDFSWERRLEAYNGRNVTVKESATVVNTDSQQSIMMTATDENLRGTSFYRAESFHDFNASMVALKPVGSKTCFLTTPRKSFAATRREIRRRVAGVRHL